MSVPNKQIILILLSVVVSSGAWGVKNPKGGGLFDGDDDLKLESVSDQIPENLICDQVLDDFESNEVGSFPIGWQTKYDHNSEEASRDKIYAVEMDKKRGSKVLVADYGTHTISLVKQVEWDIKKYPFLRWSWKAQELPKGGDEREKGKNDSAASVYVAWDVGFPLRFKVLRFAWSSVAPKGTFYQRRFKHDNIHILQSGTEKLNKWQSETINIAHLYNENILLRSKKWDPSGLLLTTDADNTESDAKASYDDFQLCRSKDK